MAQNTYTLISGTTLGSTTASITFTSIPSTYTDLLLRFSTRADASSSNDSFDTIIKFNNSATNLTFKSLRADGSGVNYNSLTDRMLRTTNSTDYTGFSNVDIYIPNYASSNTKTFNVDSVMGSTAAGTGIIIISGTWSSSSAITQIAINPNGNTGANFVTGSSAYLYGIKNS